MPFEQKQLTERSGIGADSAEFKEDLLLIGKLHYLFAAILYIYILILFGEEIRYAGKQKNEET